MFLSKTASLTFLISLKQHGFTGSDFSICFRQLVNITSSPMTSITTVELVSLISQCTWAGLPPVSRANTAHYMSRIYREPGIRSLSNIHKLLSAGGGLFVSKS